ncbi:MAG: prephenate dehydrogenase/arogenate dehydrogenase family protein [Verrucomicrobiales bacterium]|nr:prephenate dehydrogenase/arogenate dehydrogenase family protein [Verrucomicrobiales bacterium]
MDGSNPFHRVAVLGPGLLGGSILFALRKRDSEANLSVWGRREEPVEQLTSTGTVQHGSTDLAEILKENPDLIILATPIGNMPQIARQIAETSPGPAIITDVGSTKVGIVEVLESIFADRGDLEFIGSHPMAGSEKTGLENADADLFEDAACILTRSPTTNLDALERVQSLWQYLGCSTSLLEPDVHDETVARISHLPHLVAAAVVKAGLEKFSGAADFCGGGFRDTTRIASGPPEMWSEILLENRGKVIESLRDLIRELESVQQALNDLDRDRITRFLEEAKQLRDQTLSND